MKITSNKKQKSVIVCPLCLKISEKGSSRCSFCNADFNAMIVCPKCFYEQGVKNNFCQKCQHSLKKNVQYYSKKPSQTHIFSEQKKSNPFRLIILIALPLIAFVILT